MRSGRAAFIRARVDHMIRPDKAGYRFAVRPLSFNAALRQAAKHQTLFSFRGSPYSPRFAAPHAQRSELKASVNNALLGCLLAIGR
jgi:hypothetical protein